MLSRFLKPKWQHKDPKIRIAGVESLKDEKVLVELANNDPESSVKAAAIQKIGSIDDLLSIKTDDVLQLQINLRFSELLINNPLTSFTPEIGNHLRRMDNSKLNEKLAENSLNANMRATAVALTDNEPLLLKTITEDVSHDVRKAAAGKLTNEASIHQALKKLGKKDKRVTKTLRENLDKLAEQKRHNEKLDKLLKRINQLGRQPNWKRDQTQLHTITNQSSELIAQTDKKQQSDFRLATANAEQRILEQQNLTKALQPVIDSKKSQCELIEDFASNLKMRHRVSSNEAAEFNLTLDTLLEDWNELPILEEKQETMHSNRFHRGLTIVRKQINTLQTNARQSKNLERCIHQAEQLLKVKTSASRPLEQRQITKLTDEWDKQTKPQDSELAAEYDQQFSKLKQALQQKLNQQQLATEKTMAAINAWLDEIETALGNDQLGNTQTLKNKIQSSLRNHKHLPISERKKIDQRMQDINPKIRELSGWRHWGTDRAREELVDEAVTLKDVKPEDIEERANDVKALRKRWKDLGKIDPVSRQKLWKKFDSACSDAYAPCKAYFAEQATQRKKHLKQRQQICNELEDLAKNTDWSTPDWRHIDKQFQQLRNGWRNAGPVSPRDWKSIYKRFNSAVDSVDEQLQNERRINLNKRTALIQQIEALADNEDLNDATQKARELQKQWQPTVTSKRAEEQKLWKKFRAASDAVFDRDKQKKQEERAEIQELVEERETLCAEFEDLIFDQKITQGEISKFETQWSEAAQIHGKEASHLNHRFTKAKSLALNFLQKRQLEEEKSLLDSFFQRRKILETTAADQLPEKWKTLEEISSKKFAKKFEKLFKATVSDEPPGSDDKDSLLLDLEIMLELESPAALQEQRMKRQVERLSNKLSEGSEESGFDLEIKNMQAYCLSPVTKDNSARLENIKLALDKSLNMKIKDL